MPTNFLQWNPTEANQESDSEYSADTFRADGAVGGIFPSETGNKLFYQVAAFCAAYATMMANKGYAVNDSPFSTLVSVLSNVVTNADQRGALQIMTYSPAEACDASKYLGFQILLNGNVTISLSGQNMGDEIAFIFVQDATGGRTVTWPSNFYGFVQPNTTANSISVQVGKVSSDSSVHAEFTDGFEISAGTSGYFRLPYLLGGLLVNWAIGSPSPCNQADIVSETVTFQKSFSTACLFCGVFTKLASLTYAGDVAWQTVGPPTLNGQLVQMQRMSGNQDSTLTWPIVIAFGY